MHAGHSDECRLIEACALLTRPDSFRTVSVQLSADDLPRLGVVHVTEAMRINRPRQYHQRVRCTEGAVVSQRERGGSHTPAFQRPEDSSRIEYFVDRLAVLVIFTISSAQRLCNVSISLVPSC